MAASHVCEKYQSTRFVFISLAVTCPDTMSYRECSSVCPDTCRQQDLSLVCNEHCIDGCSCSNGTVSDGVECVDVASCPCGHGKKLYAAGSSLKMDCNKWYAYTGFLFQVEIS